VLDLTRVLSKTEIRSILDWLHHRRRRGPNVEVNKTIFRLSCCCGLRCIELVGLNMGDVILAGERPYLRIRKEITKGKRNVCPSNPTGKDMRRARKVPLYWDSGTLADITAYKALRANVVGNDLHAPFLAKGTEGGGQRLTRVNASRRWRSLMRTVLGAERARHLGVHAGRHTFPSMASIAGRSLAECMHALGHTNPATTARYLHAFESETAVDVFA
jgi:integrase